ncbi:hypothetical protein FZEAL_2516 [Fusarium zealandicum]|uniref:Major facilitator superfamily (MFS) profile domain-containing protein n=1 Tax=Fusarium zealandicum TaxID=1053134 RepID=A0A8H4UR96_9HYPO|nr:hypothetical protein FZEAL_2516 [Fusarium zealandicum]
MSKENIEQIETARDVPDIQDAKFEKRLLRKIDWRLLPILGCLYTIALVDRSNVAVARISGMDEDLGLDQGNRASVALMVFFIGYIIFEIPSNAFIHKLGAANWLSFLAVAWGLVSLGIGFLNDWKAFAVMRSFLGVFEAGFFPGCVYLVSSWYKRYEVQKRMAGFFLTASALSAFANILAYGLIQISKHHSYKGWRWIFIVEGAITILTGIGSWFIIIDFPDSAANTFLTPEERAFVKARLAADRGPEDHEKVTLSIILQTAADWKPWAFSLMYIAGAVGVYAFLFFLPIILRDGLGYSLELSFILSTPPALFSVVEAIFISWLADKTRLRGPFVIFQGLIGLVGLCMTGFLNSPTPRYIGTFLGVAGANGLVVTTLAWQANNIVGDSRRAVSTAILISMSGFGGIYSSMVFRQQDAPNYIPGIIAVMAINVAAVVTAIVTMLLLRVQNKRADKAIGFFIPYLFRVAVQRAVAVHHSWTWRNTAESKSVVVLGGSFAGIELVRRLAETLPTGFKVIWIEKNSHLNYSFNFPRFSVVSGLEHTAFIPYDGVAKNAPDGIFTRIQDTAVGLTDGQVLLVSGEKIDYAYLAIATGSSQPLPVQVSSTERADACQELQSVQLSIKSSQKIAIIGGGAVGVELASDIKDFYPDKDVTLIHSRNELLSHFGKKLQDYALDVLKNELHVRVLLNERPKTPALGSMRKSTTLAFADGREEKFDLVIGCTGQRPNSAILTSLLPESISKETSRILVQPTLQVAIPDASISNRPIFAFGDVADHGGPRMARAGWMQAGVVLDNILAMIHGQTPPRTYKPNLFVERAIKLTLGKKHSVVYSVDDNGSDVIIPSRGGRLDLGIEQAWKQSGADFGKAEEVAVEHMVKPGSGAYQVYGS